MELLKHVMVGLKLRQQNYEFNLHRLLIELVDTENAFFDIDELVVWCQDCM